ncbi:MAG TPA: PLP-dependent aminotransferase family protein [Bryobacteraceae bacterium]
MGNNWTATEIQSLVRHLGSWSLGKGSLQQKLARALTQAVRNGFLIPGSRLPSERTLARALMLSRTTVVAAYDVLREAGWLESRSGSGTWVCARSTGVAAARSAARDAALNQSPLFNLLGPRDSEDRLDFALGTPLPLEELPMELFTIPPGEYAAMVRDRHYYPLGLATLRRALARMFSQDGLETTEEQVLITNGAQAAISLCAALYVQRGDTVLVEDPTYFGALDAFRTADARMTMLPVGPHGVAPAMIRERIKNTAARLVYLTPTFQNPTGSVMPAAARKELGKIVSESGVPVVDDGALADLALDGPAPPPLAASAPQAAFLTIGSLSKLAWPGLRVGWVRAPAWIIERLARLKSSLDLASPLLTQAIAVRIVEDIERLRRLRRAQLKPRRDLLATLLGKRLPEWTFRVPSGGLCLWVKLPHGDARELAQVALRHGVILLPGPLASAMGRYESYLRIPFLAEPETLRTAVHRLATAWKDYQSNARPQREQPLVVV